MVGAQHQQGVENPQMQKIELVGSGLDRLPGGRPRRQGGGAPGCRLGQVGAQFQQADQLVVGQRG